MNNFIVYEHVNHPQSLKPYKEVHTNFSLYEIQQTYKDYGVMLRQQFQMVFKYPLEKMRTAIQYI